MEEASHRYDTLGSFNADQGCQFTREAFATTLKARGIPTSVALFRQSGKSAA